MSECGREPRAVIVMPSATRTLHRGHRQCRRRGRTGRHRGPCMPPVLLPPAVAIVYRGPAHGAQDACLSVDGPPPGATCARRNACATAVSPRSWRLRAIAAAPARRRRVRRLLRPPAGARIRGGAVIGTYRVLTPQADRGMPAARTSTRRSTWPRCARRGRAWLNSGVPASMRAFAPAARSWHCGRPGRLHDRAAARHHGGLLQRVGARRGCRGGIVVAPIWGRPACGAPNCRVLRRLPFPVHLMAGDSDAEAPALLKGYSAARVLD